MYKDIIDLQNKFSEELGRAAHEYLEFGLNMFHQHRRSECSCSQSAIGNLILATEMLIKSFIASKNLGNIFTDIPPEIRVILSNPESIPKFFKWRTYDIDIHSEKYTTLDFDDCISCFYIYYPQQKQLIMPHISFLSRWKNASLYRTLPEFNTYEFQKIGYAVLQIVIMLNNDETFQYSWYTLTEDDKDFLKDFDEQRVDRVELTLQQARTKTSDIDANRLETVVAHNWETFVTYCPVCGRNGLLEGYTEMATGEDEEGAFPTLDFFAVTFNCEECRLKLNDIEELKLARMSILYDRSAELDDWFMDHEQFCTWDTDKMD